MDVDFKKTGSKMDGCFIVRGGSRWIDCGFINRVYVLHKIKTNDILRADFVGNFNEDPAARAEFYGRGGGRAFFGLLHQE